MNAQELLAALESRGAELEVMDGHVAVTLVEGDSLKPEEREALMAHKPELRACLSQRQAPPTADWLRVRLADLDRVLEVAVPWAEVPLLIVPGCRRAEALRAADPNPGRVWCTCQVIDLILSGVTPRDAQAIAQAALAFDGSVQGVRPMPESEPEPSWPPAPARASRR